MIRRTIMQTQGDISIHVKSLDAFDDVLLSFCSSYLPLREVNVVQFSTQPRNNCFNFAGDNSMINRLQPLSFKGQPPVANHVAVQKSLVKMRDFAHVNRV